MIQPQLGEFAKILIKTIGFLLNFFASIKKNPHSPQNGMFHFGSFFVVGVCVWVPNQDEGVSECLYRVCTLSASVIDRI